MSRYVWCAVVCVASLACAQNPTSRGEPSTRKLEFKHGDVTLEGTLAVDSTTTGQRPGILIAHEMGNNDPLASARAAQFAKLGYIAFSADLIGNGNTPRDRADVARRLSDRNEVAQRLDAALEVLAKQPLVAPHKIAGVGYGLGGTALLDLARSDADVAGVACLHADWSAPDSKPNKISSRILAFMGADDPRTSLAKQSAFEAEMKASGADWDIVRFGGVAGDFTNPKAGADLRTGFAYDIDADLRSQAAIRQFLIELFPPKSSRSFAGATEKPKSAPQGVPERVLKVLQYVDDHDRAMDGYEGGRHFGNFEKRLPSSDRNGRRIRYREWDVHPLRPGVNRGPERLITGSDGSAHYTADHYSTFKKVR